MQSGTEFNKLIQAFINSVSDIWSARDSLQQANIIIPMRDMIAYAQRLDEDELLVACREHMTIDEVNQYIDTNLRGNRRCKIAKILAGRWPHPIIPATKISLQAMFSRCLFENINALECADPCRFIRNLYAAGLNAEIYALFNYAFSTDNADVFRWLVKTWKICTNTSMEHIHRSTVPLQFAANFVNSTLTMRQIISDAHKKRAVKCLGELNLAAVNFSGFGAKDSKPIELTHTHMRLAVQKILWSMSMQPEVVTILSRASFDFAYAKAIDIAIDTDNVMLLKYCMVINSTITSNGYLKRRAIMKKAPRCFDALSRQLLHIGITSEMRANIGDMLFTLVYGPQLRRKFASALALFKAFPPENISCAIRDITEYAIATEDIALLRYVVLKWHNRPTIFVNLLQNFPHALAKKSVMDMFTYNDVTLIPRD